MYNFVGMRIVLYSDSKILIFLNFWETTKEIELSQFKIVLSKVLFNNFITFCKYFSLLKDTNKMGSVDIFDQINK